MVGGVAREIPFRRFLYVPLGVLVSISAASLYSRGIEMVLFEERWFIPFVSLLVVLVLLTSWVAIFPRRGVVVVVLLQGCIVYLSTFPVGGATSIRALLSAALIAEIIFAIPRPLSLILSLIAALGLQYYPSGVEAWGRPVALPALSDRLVLAAVDFVSAFLASMFDHYTEALRTNRKESARQRQIVESLAAANLGYQHHLALVELRSKDEERKRITLEIHNALGYTLTNISMLMEAAINIVSPTDEKLRSIISKTREQALEGLYEMRKSLRLLRASPVHAERGIPGFQRLIRAFSESTGVEIDTDYRNLAWAIDEEWERSMYQVLQEALTNAIRHGRATLISIRFWQTGESLQLVVRDNGSGSKNASANGIGLKGIREIAEASGGSVQTNSDPQGFEIQVELRSKRPKPLAEEEIEDPNRR